MGKSGNKNKTQKKFLEEKIFVHLKQKLIQKWL